MENYVLINRKLIVLEGEKSLIDENHLFLRSIDYDVRQMQHQHRMPQQWNTENGSIMVEIIRQPQFGTIAIIFEDHIEKSPTIISQQLILDKKVFYIHDNSETMNDSFDFFIKNSTNFELISAKFSIEIELKNDNPPMNKIDNKRFNIIKNGERILTNKDLCFTDMDLNTWPSNITFSKIYSPIGDFYFINDTIAQRFTQEDIDNGLVMFKHNGTDLGKAIFTVSDGQYSLTDSLLIKASEPYIEIKANNGIIVKYGETSVITSKNLSIETNFPDKNEIFIKLITETRFGEILINEKPTNQFSLQVNYYKN